MAVDLSGIPWAVSDAGGGRDPFGATSIAPGDGISNCLPFGGNFL